MTRRVRCQPNRTAASRSGWIPISAATDRGPADFDRRHNLTANFIWTTPDLTHTPGVLRHLLGNWTVSGDSCASGPGTPSPSGSRATTRARSRACRCTGRICGAGVDPDDIILGGAERYFDPAAFELQAPGTFGNVPRNSLTGPGAGDARSGIREGDSDLQPSRRTTRVSSGRLQRAQPRQLRHAAADRVPRRATGGGADQQRRPDHLDNYRTPRGPAQSKDFMVRSRSARSRGAGRTCRREWHRLLVGSLGSFLMVMSTACGSPPASNASAAERPEAPAGTPRAGDGSSSR